MYFLKTNINLLLMIRKEGNELRFSTLIKQMENARNSAATPISRSESKAAGKANTLFYLLFTSNYN